MLTPHHRPLFELTFNWGVVCWVDCTLLRVLLYFFMILAVGATCYLHCGYDSSLYIISSLSIRLRPWASSSSVSFIASAMPAAAGIALARCPSFATTPSAPARVAAPSTPSAPAGVAALLHAVSYVPGLPPTVAARDSLGGAGRGGQMIQNISLGLRVSYILYYK